MYGEPSIMEIPVQLKTVIRLGLKNFKDLVEAIAYQGDITGLV